MPTNNQKRNVALLFVASLAFSGDQSAAGAKLDSVLCAGKVTAAMVAVGLVAATAQIVTDEYSATEKTRAVQKALSPFARLKTALKAVGRKDSWRTKGRGIRETLKPLPTKNQLDATPSTFTNIGTLVKTNKTAEAVIVASLVFFFREALIQKSKKGLNYVRELNFLKDGGSIQNNGETGSDEKSTGDAPQPVQTVGAPQTAATTSTARASSAAPAQCVQPARREKKPKSQQSPQNSTKSGNARNLAHAAAGASAAPQQLPHRAATKTKGARSQPKKTVEVVSDTSGAAAPEQMKTQTPQASPKSAPSTAPTGHEDQSGSFIPLASATLHASRRPSLATAKDAAQDDIENSPKTCPSPSRMKEVTDEPAREKTPSPALGEDTEQTGTGAPEASSKFVTETVETGPNDVGITKDLTVTSDDHEGQAGSINLDFAKVVIDTAIPESKSDSSVGASVPGQSEADVTEIDKKDAENV